MEDPDRIACRLKSPKIVRAPIDRLGRTGLLIRKILLDNIISGAPLVVAFEKLRNPVLTRIMKAFSFLGLEDFFTPLILFLIWVVDFRFGVLFMVLLSTGFYSASFFKCLLCLPRPPVPPVRPLTSENRDWAVPSNHSIMGIMMPWFIYFYSQDWVHRSSYGSWLLVICITWSMGVMVSRLYLGVHGPIDLITGSIVGGMMLKLFWIWHNWFYHNYLTSTYMAWLSIPVFLLALFLHPRTWPETQSYGESVVVTSAALGMVVGRRVGFGALPAKALLQTLPGETPWVLMTLKAEGRLVLGVLILLAWRYVMKRWVQRFCLGFCDLFDIEAYSFSEYCKTHKQPLTKHYTEEYQLPPLENPKKTDENLNLSSMSSPYSSPHNANDQRDDDASAQHASAQQASALNASAQQASALNASAQDDNMETLEDYSNRPWDVDICTRIVVYGGMGWLATEFVPLVFRWLRL